MTDVNIRRLQGNDIKNLPTLYSKHLYRRGAYQVRLSITKPNAWAKTVCNRLYLEYIFNKPLCILGMETFVCAIAETNNGEIVGTAVARRQTPFAKAWNLGLVVTHTEYRGRGISTRMINFLFGHLEARKAKELTLIVNKYSAAKGLYKKLGFTSLGQLYITYGNIPCLSIRQSFPRKKLTDISVKMISTRIPNQSFINFWFRKALFAFPSIFFKEFPRIDTFAVFRSGKLIGFIRVDNSKFSDTSIVEELNLQPGFQDKGVIKEAFEALFKALERRGVKKIVFQVIRNSMDRVDLRDILLELNLRRVTTYNIMLKEWYGKNTRLRRLT